MPDETAFAYDVFLSHSAKDKPIVRDIAERLKKDGVKQSEFVIRHSSFGFYWLCMSAHAFGSDWAQLACPAVASERRGKSGTFRFRDPPNKERRFHPPAPRRRHIKGALMQHKGRSRVATIQQFRAN